MSDIKNKLKELIFVPKCIACNKPADYLHLCENCRSDMMHQRISKDKRRLDKKFDMVDGAYASYYYRGAAQKAVRFAKFSNPASFLSSFIDDISIDIKDILEENNIDMVVSAPCHKSKFYTQEYDLPQEMAKRISLFAGVELSDCIVKKKKTARQHDLTLEKRKVNLINAFEVVKNVEGRKILIIDDVITSGITASTLATELKLAGADAVYVWVYTYNT